ncbi:MAG: LptF/LptG family permease, partial [Pirellulaceae bacterium]
EQRIEQPNFQLYRTYGSFGRYLRGATASYHEATGDRPAGYRLDEVTDPKEPATMPSVTLDGMPIILTSRDHPWLAPNSLFVVSDVSFDQLAGGVAWRRYASTWELISEVRNPSLDFGLDARVMLHSRFVQPLLDMTLFLLGLPLVLARESRNIFVSIGLCFGVVLVFFLVVVACQGLGNSGYLLSPSLAAWCPLLIFLPIAAAVSSSLWE